MKENLCVAAGCEALCCTHAQPGMNADVFFDIFLPRARDKGLIIQELSPENFGLISSLVGAINLRPAIFYTTKGDRVAVQIVGSCPNLDEETLNCLIFPEPIGCRNFKRGGKDCTTRRNQEGLDPIPIEFHE